MIHCDIYCLWHCLRLMWLWPLTIQAHSIYSQQILSMRGWHGCWRVTSFGGMYKQQSKTEHLRITISFITFPIIVSRWEINPNPNRMTIAECSIPSVVICNILLFIYSQFRERLEHSHKYIVRAYVILMTCYVVGISLT